MLFTACKLLHILGSRKQQGSGYAEDHDTEYKISFLLLSLFITESVHEVHSTIKHNQMKKHK